MTSVATPCACAMASPGASPRLLITSTMLPLSCPAASAASSAARLDPRPEIRTEMRRKAAMGSVRLLDRGARLAVCAWFDATDRVNRLARLLETTPAILRRAGAHDHDHADAAIEYAVHLHLGDAAVHLQPLEDLRARPRGALDARGESR